VQLLFDAQVNLYAPALTPEGHSKLTCLHLAISKRNVDILKYILSKTGNDSLYCFINFFCFSADNFHSSFVGTEEYHVLKWAHQQMPKQCGINFQTKLKGFFVLARPHVTELNFNRFTGETYSVFSVQPSGLEFVEPKQVFSLASETAVAFVQHADKEEQQTEKE